MRHDASGNDELAERANYLRTIVDYVDAASPLGMAATMLRQTIDQAVDSGKLSSLKSLEKELTDWARQCLSEVGRGELEALLVKKLGRGLGNPMAEAVERVLERGKIRTATEYRAVTTRVDEILTDGSRREEVARLNALLLDFDDRRRA